MTTTGARPLPARGAARSRAGALIRQFLQRHAPVLSRAVSDFHRQPDRMLLETVILDELALDPKVERILFVGCDWYTQPYGRMFRDKTYWTLDIDPDKRRFGAAHHLTGRLRDLHDHAPAAFFDAIVCNGVFMTTAIETFEEAEPSFEACLNCLRPGGWFVLGWNDTDALRPYFPSESPTLQRFDPVAFPRIDAHEIPTPTEYRHTYTFFRRPL
jgi:SAM-dependent methyltransferase